MNQPSPQPAPPPLDPEMFDPVCPSPLVPFRIGDKWASLILRCLQDGPRRFSELKVPLRDITSKSLTQSLRGLERDGFVTRDEHEGPQRRVQYTLTPLGRGLLGPLDTACEWTREHWDELIDAHEAGQLSVPASSHVRHNATHPAPRDRKAAA